MRRTKEERSTHRTVMRKTNSLQPASRKKARFCTLGALLTEMSETIVPSAIECNLHRPKSTNISSQSPRVWAVVWIEVLHAKKASLFFSILFLQLCFLHFTGQFPGIGTVCTGGNLQMCKVQWLGNILPITHALYSTKFLLRRWTSPQPSVHAGD